MPERQEIFADCGRIILAVYTTNDKNIQEKQVGRVRAARLATLAIIREMAAASEDYSGAMITANVRAALNDLHPEIDYMLDDKLIRDLADISATFQSIETGKERSSREKLLEAKLFCDHMRDELNGLAKK